MDIIQEAKEVIRQADEAGGYLKSKGIPSKSADYIDLICRLVDRLEWKPIETAPRGEIIDTYGFWVNKRNSYRKYIRNCDDFIGENTVNPLTCTYFEHEGVTGTYTRTHWMPIPLPPVGDK